MSRRCDREGVAGIPRALPGEDLLNDPLARREYLALVWRPSPGRYPRSFEVEFPQHNAVLRQLRERPILPPWADVTFYGRSLGRCSVDDLVAALEKIADDIERRRRDVIDAPAQRGGGL